MEKRSVDLVGSHDILIWWDKLIGIRWYKKYRIWTYQRFSGIFWEKILIWWEKLWDSLMTRFPWFPWSDKKQFLFSRIIPVKCYSFKHFKTIYPMTLSYPILQFRDIKNHNTPKREVEFLWFGDKCGKAKATNHTHMLHVWWINQKNGGTFPIFRDTTHIIHVGSISHHLHLLSNDIFPFSVILHFA